MDPQQQYPENSNQSNPYEFILNPPKAPRRKRVSFGKNNLPMTIGLVVGGALVLMIIVTIILNAFTPEKINKDDLIGLAQTQTELIRITNQGNSYAVLQASKNLATTVEFTMLTQRKQTVDVLAKNGVTTNEKQLALKQKAATDQKFTTARETSTFDKTFTEVMQTELTAYANTLKGLSTKAASTAERDRLSDYYRQTQLLIGQIPYAQDNIDAAGTTR